MKLSFLTLALVLFVPSAAYAQDDDSVEPAAASPIAVAPMPAELPRVVPAAPRYDYLRFGLGFRISYLPSGGYDTFSKDDVLPQVALDASYAFYTHGKVAVAIGAAWDVGSATAGARGLTTRLTSHRLTMPIEARFYVTPRVDVFAKVAPGAASLFARVEDPSSPSTLEQVAWVFATDLSAGATIRLAGSSDPSRQSPRLWITHEIGYGLTSSHVIRPKPNRDDADVLGSDESAHLGSLALNGMFFRTGLALSF